MRTLLLLALCLGAAVAQDDAYLGVGVAPAEGGLSITQITEGSAAAAAGFRSGDRLVEFDGRKIEGIEQFIEQVRSKKAGDKVSYILVRGDGSISGTLTLGKRSAPAIDAPRPEVDIEERIERAQAAVEAMRARVMEMRARRSAPAREIPLEARMAALQKTMEAQSARMDRIEAKLDEILKALRK